MNQYDEDGLLTNIGGIVFAIVVIALIVAFNAMVNA